MDYQYRYVLIKTWEEMETEFGLTEVKHINCNKIFTNEMENLMPSFRVIKINQFNSWITNSRHFSISSDMIAQDNIKIYTLSKPMHLPKSDKWYCLVDENHKLSLCEDGTLVKGLEKNITFDTKEDILKAIEKYNGHPAPINLIISYKPLYNDIMDGIHKLNMPTENHPHGFYIGTEDDKGYLWNDGLIHEKATSLTDKTFTGYYPTFQVALFHKLKYERVHKDALCKQS